MEFDPQPIVDAVKSVVGGNPYIVPLHAPQITEDDRTTVNRCLMYEPVGHNFVQSFEADLRSIHHGHEAVAVSSCTAALHLALLCAGVRPGDEVLMPSLTFAATAAAVRYCGATPHFIDSSISDLGIMPYKLGKYIDTAFKSPGPFSRRSGARLGAIIAVDLLGLPSKLLDIDVIAQKYGVPLIEDAAQALGTTTVTGQIGGTCDIRKAAGTFGMAAALSFNANKIVTTGGGGALLTADKELAAKARHLATTSKIPHPWRYQHDGVGFNYRMPNINAALGVDQLRRLEMTVEAKRRLWQAYRTALGPLMKIGAISMLDEQPGWRWNAWLTPIFLPPGLEMRQKRDSLLNALHRAGIQARALFDPLHTLAPYALCPRSDLTLATYLADRVVCLPGGVGLAPRS